jgi:hypothetical protein
MAVAAGPVVPVAVVVVQTSTTRLRSAWWSLWNAHLPPLQLGTTRTAAAMLQVQVQVQVPVLVQERVQALAPV